MLVKTWHGSTSRRLKTNFPWSRCIFAVIFQIDTELLPISLAAISNLRRKQMSFKPVQIHSGRLIITSIIILPEYLSSDLTILYFDFRLACLVCSLMVSFHAVVICIGFRLQHKWICISTLASMMYYFPLGILHRFPQVLLGCEPQGVVTLSVGGCGDLLLQSLGQEACLSGFDGAAD